MWWMIPRVGTRYGEMTGAAAEGASAAATGALKCQRLW
jgi:hypothetical protein